MTVGENVEYGLKIAKVPKPECRRRAGEALEMGRLDGYDARRPRQHPGRRQRMALAWAVAGLRGLGVRLARPARGRGAGPGELTGREREIAELVAAGRSNKQVAAAVLLSEKDGRAPPLAGTPSSASARARSWPPRGPMEVARPVER